MKKPVFNKDISADELAEKIENGSPPLTNDERKEAGAMIRTYGKILKAARLEKNQRYATDEERRAARRTTQNKSNARRRERNKNE